MAVIDDPRNYMPDRDGDGVPDALEAAGMVQNAPVQEVEAQRGLLSEALGALSRQHGIDPFQVAQQAGVGTPDVNALGAGDLAQLTIHLARTNPEILHAVAQHFPAAQPLLAILTGGQATPVNSGGGIGGGILGGLLGRVLGGR